jgi:hypothetical protein
VSNYDPEKHTVFRRFHTLQEAQAAHKRVSIIRMYSDYGGDVVELPADHDKRYGLYIAESCRRYSTTWEHMCNCVDDFMMGFREGMKAQEALTRQDPRWDPLIERCKATGTEDESLIIESPDGAVHELRRRWREVEVFNVAKGYYEYMSEYFWLGRQSQTADGKYTYSGFDLELPATVKGYRSAIKSYLKEYAARAN